MCKVYTLPHEFHSPNLPHPNNNAGDYSLPARDNYWHQVVSVGIFWHNSHSLCLDQQIFTSHTKPKGCQFSDNTDFAYRSRVLYLGAVVRVLTCVAVNRSTFNGSGVRTRTCKLQYLQACRCEKIYSRNKSDSNIFFKNVRS